MATISKSTPHIVRTAKDPRQQGLHRVTVSKVEQVNSSVRLIQLEFPSTGSNFNHLPGQWLDVYIPSISQAGGFTITSAPQHMGKNNGKNGNHDASRYLELAIQKSHNNPPAAFFWRAPNYILGTPLLIRVGGRFVYPPPDLSEEEGQAIKRVVFIAGGVGINPIMSMLEHLHLESLLSPSAISSLRLLYGTRATLGVPILFHERIARILGKYMGGRLDAGAADRDYRGVLYVTGGTGWSSGRAAGYEDLDTAHIELEYRRINRTHLLEALGPVPQRKDTVAYVCGPPNMTDDFVELLSEAEAMDPRRVLCEKWW